MGEDNDNLIGHFNSMVQKLCEVSLLCHEVLFFLIQKNDLLPEKMRQKKKIAHTHYSILQTKILALKKEAETPWQEKIILTKS